MNSSTSSHNSRNHLLNVKNISQKDVLDLFVKTTSLKADFFQSFKTKTSAKPIKYSGGNSIALLFFEPSTRTRVSFEMAAHRLGYPTISLTGAAGTSLEKGESLEDSFENILAMNPEAIVVRAPQEFKFEQMLAVADQKKIPVLNGGWGVSGHPSQALLDAFTIWSEKKNIEGKKVLIVGDAKHSRVVASHLELSKILNYEIKFSAPESFLSSEMLKGQKSVSLQDGLEWCDSVIMLRVQFERHDGTPNKTGFDVEDYKNKFQLNHTSLKHLKPQALVMHPGPVNYGIELSPEMGLEMSCHFKNPNSRFKVYEQVENGVFIRQTLLQTLLERTSN